MNGLYGRLFTHEMALPGSADAVDPRALPSGGGVCALVADDDRLVQLLAGRSLRRMLALRLDPRRQGASGKRAELGSVVRRLWWRLTGSVFETDWVYLLVARQLLGPGYRKQLGFGPVWYTAIRLADDHPHWQVTDAPFGAGVTAAGPFATRKRATAFVADLEDLYDLCRYPDVLKQAPRGERCAYYDMGKCPAPCDGTIGMARYREMVTAAARGAIAGAAEQAERLRARMAQAAEALDFETAQRCRDALATAEALDRKDKRFAPSPAALRMLIVQRGTQSGFIRPFFFNAGRLDAGADVGARDFAAAATDWARRMQAGPASDNPADLCTDLRRDQTALVCHHWGKSDKAPGVYLNYPDARDAETILARVQAAFGAPRG